MPSGPRCGEVVTLSVHDGARVRYAMTRAPSPSGSGPRRVLLLLVGGGGTLNLDDGGCPTALNGNVLVRIAPIVRAAGIDTVLVDAPNDHVGGDGLAGFRADPAHADDLGKIIADIRDRAGASVTLVGHSRGTISAANAAARLAGPSAPDGMILLSAMIVGGSGGQKAFAAQTVFDLPLERITVPTLIVGHATDNCVRSPAAKMDDVRRRLSGAHAKVVALTGGPFKTQRAPNLRACEVGQPHDFVDQDEAVADLVLKFLREEAGR